MLLGTNGNFTSGYMYRNVECKLQEIVIVLCIAIVKDQLEYCIQDFIFQDGYNCSEKIQGEQELQKRRLEGLKAFMWKKLEGETM